MSTFDPFREMDRLFSSSLRTAPTSVMPMDLYRSGEDFIARIDLPGVEPSTIDIDVEEAPSPSALSDPPRTSSDVRWSPTRSHRAFARRDRDPAGPDGPSSSVPRTRSTSRTAHRQACEASREAAEASG